MQPIESEIRNFIVENYMYGQSPESLRDTDSFLALGVIDSAGILELVAYLEETFKMQVNDDELLPENLDSIAQVAAYVRRKTGSETMAGVAHAG